MASPTLLLLLLAAGPQWKRLDTVDGIDIFSREVPNERFVEFRLTTISEVSIERLCDAAYATAQVDSEEPSVSSRTVLSESATERVTYEQVAAPLTSARDYAVRVKRESLPDGTCRTTFSAANDLAPPLPPGFVRIEKLRGSWRFEAAGGVTRATYTIFTDPGGSIPSVFVEGPRQRSAVTLVKLVLKRAARGLPAR